MRREKRRTRQSHAAFPCASPAHALQRGPDHFVAILINKDPATDLDVDIQSSGKPFASSAIIQLSAPSLDATSEVEFGGPTLSVSGTWPELGNSSINLPRGSVALVHLNL